MWAQAPLPLCRAREGAGAALSCPQAWVAVGAWPSSRRRWGPLLVCHWHAQPGTLPRREPVPGRGRYCFQSCDVVWTEAWGSWRLVTSPGARFPSPLTGLACASCPSVPSTLIMSPLALVSLLLFRLCALVSAQQLHLPRRLSGAPVARNPPERGRSSRFGRRPVCLGGGPGPG